MIEPTGVWVLDCRLNAEISSENVGIIFADSTEALQAASKVLAQLHWMTSWVGGGGGGRIVGSNSVRCNCYLILMGVEAFGGSAPGRAGAWEAWEKWRQEMRRSSDPASKI